MALCLSLYHFQITAIQIPPRNNNDIIHFKPHFLKIDPNAKPLNGTNSHNHALRSLPLKHFNYESTSSSSNLNDDTSIKGRVLKHIERGLGGDDPWESLDVIDALQRLGIDYLFQHEIDAILQSHHQYPISQPSYESEIDLHKVALRFRLLRQQGCYVPPDAFESFMDKEGNFKESLKEDIKGVASLYEASMLCMHGEEAIIEKATKFTKQILHATATDPNYHNLSKFVEHTLAHPTHRSPSVFMVKIYFGDTQWMNKWISMLKQVAKVEFDNTQALHQKEIHRLFQWWEESGLGEECKFARHQPLVWYASSLGFFSDPRFSEERVLLAKAICFVYVIDDIFDEYGTLHQLALFTSAVIRWNMDVEAEDQLPNCMKRCLTVLYEVTNEISNAVNQKHGNYNPTESLKKAWGEQCKSFLRQAEWVKSGEWVRADEYLKNGIITTGFPLGMVHAFHLLGEGVSHQTLQLLQTHPDIVSSSATILRLFDDIEAFQGGEDGYDASYVEYYMKEHKGISIETTRQHIEKLISNSWKTLNQACLLPNPFPFKFIHSSINTVRIFHLISDSKSDQSSQNLKKLMASVLFQNVDQHN